MKPRLLTGDTPTGKLHLGHYVGSVENRLALQDDFDCFFLIANKHAFTTRADTPDDIRQSVLDIATDWLAVGIDPHKSAMFVQSEVPAIDELTFFFAMLIPFNRVMRNPPLTQEIKDKDLGEPTPSFRLRHADPVQPGDAEPDAHAGDQGQGPRRQVPVRVPAVRRRPVR